MSLCRLVVLRRVLGFCLAVSAGRSDEDDPSRSINVLAIATVDEAFRRLELVYRDYLQMQSGAVQVCYFAQEVNVWSKTGKVKREILAAADSLE